MAASDDGLRGLLSLERAAVVGCSGTPGKAAREIPAHLQRHGYDVYPVNPYADEVLGREAAGSLSDVDAVQDRCMKVEHRRLIG